MCFNHQVAIPAVDFLQGGAEEIVLGQVHEKGERIIDFQMLLELTIGLQQAHVFIFEPLFGQLIAIGERVHRL